MKLKDQFIKQSIDDCSIWISIRKIRDVGEYDASKQSDAVLGDDWRIVCGWYSSIFSGQDFKYTREQVIELACKILSEILARGRTRFHPDAMKPRSGDLFEICLPKFQRQGIYLAEPHGKLIANGKKSLIVKAKVFENKLRVPLYLVSNSKSYGIIYLTSAKPIDIPRFNELKKQHFITDAERNKWWPGMDRLYSYEFRILTLFPEPKPVEMPQGVQNFITDVQFKKQYDEEYYAGLVNWQENSICDAESVMREVIGHKVLEMGSGTGRLVKMLGLSGYDATGIDSAIAALDRCKSDSINVIKGNAEELEFPDESYDTVVSMHLLEHLEDPEKAVSESLRVAKSRVVHLVPLGKRYDSTHKHQYMRLGDFKQLFKDISYDCSFYVNRMNCGVAVIDKESQGIFGDITDQILVPDYISIVGSAVKSATPHDIDIVVRDEQFSESDEVAVRNTFKRELWDKLHFICEPKGPHGDYIPIADKVIRMKRCQVRDVEVNKADNLKPLTYFTPLKTGSGYTLQEYADIETLYEQWAKAYLNRDIPISVQVKYNGWRTIGESDDAGKALIFFEGTRINRDRQFPDLAKELALLKGIVFDMDLGAVGADGKPLPRKDLAFWNRKGIVVPSQFTSPEGIKGSLVGNVFDVLYYRNQDLHSRTYEVRRNILEEIFGKYDFKTLKLAPETVCKTKEELVAAVDKARRKPGSEGAVLKTLTADYPLSGQTPTWSKIKNIAEIKVQAVSRVSIKDSPGVYKYDIAYQGAKGLVPIGSTMNIKLKAEPGDILTLTVEEVVVKKEKGNWEISFIAPVVRDIDTSRKTPETMSDIVARAEQYGILQANAEQIVELKRDKILKSIELPKETGGLWIRARIDDDEIWKWIEEEKVTGFSWSGNPIKYSVIALPEKQYMVLEAAEIYDISVVTIPADIETNIKIVDKEKHIIEGLVSTSEENRHYEFVLPSAFTDAIKTYMEKPPKGTIFFNHKFDRPVGKAVELKVIQFEKRTKEEGTAGEFGNVDFKPGDKGEGVLQVHIMGLSEEEAKKLQDNSASVMDSLKRGIGAFADKIQGFIKAGAHIDMRLAPSGKDFWEGGEIFIGNVEGLDKLSKYKEGDKLRFQWKQSRAEEGKAETIRGALGWLDEGSTKPKIYKPGEVGALAKTWGAMIRIDRFNWDAGTQDKHYKEFKFAFNPKILEPGRWIMSFVPVGQGRVWMFSRPGKQEMDEQTGQKKDINKYIPIVKVDNEKRIVCGIVYSPYEVDAQGDWMTPEEIEKAAHNYLIKYRKLTKNHDKELKDCYIAESNTTPQDETIGGQLVKRGSWVVKIKVLNDNMWNDIKTGDITGLSMAGSALGIEKEA